MSNEIHFTDQSQDIYDLTFVKGHFAGVTICSSININMSLKEIHRI